jgi:GNAT superfamily N-acetyltransferase
LVRSALPFGVAFGVVGGDRLLGVALWYPPGVAPPVLSSNTVAALREVIPAVPAAARLAPRAVASMREPNALVRFVRQRGRAIERASARPSWHLAYLAVEPEHRRRGVARLLLEHVLGRCDEDGAAAWLETTDPANPAIYERFGFHTVHAIPATRRLPALWVMRRDAGAGDGG